jgi:hypothetical protein
MCYTLHAIKYFVNDIAYKNEVKGCVLQKACHLQAQPLEICTWGSKIKYYIIHIIAKGTFYFAKKLKQE